MSILSRLSTLDRFTERSTDRLVDWALTHGVEALVTLIVAGIALRIATVLIDRADRALEAANNTLSVNTRRTQRARTLTAILRSTTRTVILFAAVLALLSAVGLNITPLLASAGVVGLALGFGAQSLVKDVIAGFFTLLEDQYGVGDVVDIDGKAGVVERMNLRITQLRNLSGDLITIPNGAIKIVSNQSNEWSRAILEIAVPYDADLDHALAVIVSCGQQLQLERSAEILEAPEVLGVHAFGESSVTLRVIMKTAPMARGPIACEWRRRVKAAFDMEGIALAVPQRVLKMVSEKGETAASEAN